MIESGSARGPRSARRLMIRSVTRVPVVALVSSLMLASCGASTTKTVTTVVPAPVTNSSSTTTSTTTPTATSSSSTPSTTSITSTATAAPVYFQGVTTSRAQRPPTLELTGDGTLFVSGVQWTSWGGSVATGSGNAEYHGCTPNCAQATPHSALVSIRLAGIRVCAGRQYYASVTLTMNSGQQLDRSYLQRSWSPC